VAVNDHKAELAAYKLLYPAMGTYVGGALIPTYGALVGAGVGHIVGRTKAAARARHYRRRNTVE
jgi:hypothetical protein